VSLREIYYFEVVLFLVLLDPFVSLPLGIDEKRPPLALRRNDTIIDAQRVVGEALNDPLSDGEWSLQCLRKRVVFAKGNPELCELFLPPDYNWISIGASEGSEIGDSGC
jgi:hypothetical protein